MVDIQCMDCYLIDMDRLRKSISYQSIIINIADEANQRNGIGFKNVMDCGLKKAQKAKDGRNDHCLLLLSDEIVNAL